MAKVVLDTTNTAYGIRDAFRNYGRDNYPMQVYQFILDELEASEEDYVELDVIAWACDLSETSVPEDEDFDDAVYDLKRQTIVIYADEDSRVIHHLAY